jgi:hypothetical protein
MTPRNSAGHLCLRELDPPRLFVNNKALSNCGRIFSTTNLRPWRVREFGIVGISKDKVPRN